jgi:Cu/Ag efflux protein CusF
MNMKTTKLGNWTAVCAAFLTATAVFRASADQSATAVKPEKNYTGMIVSVDPKEHTLEARGWIFSKRFNLGTSCSYVLPDTASATAADLRPGEKVVIRYQDANGVLVADRVEQLPMRYEGMVKAIDPGAHTLTLHLTGRDETFQIANDCGVELRGDKSGTLADVQAGDHVTVTYEKPGGKLMARQIAQTSLEFTGTLTAIDLGEKTVKAKSAFTSKKFNVGDDCAIVIHDQPDGRLSDLKPNDKLVFNYDEINGVNVVNRIAPAESRPNPATAKAGRMEDDN